MMDLTCYATTAIQARFAFVATALELALACILPGFGPTKLSDLSGVISTAIVPPLT